MKYLPPFELIRRAVEISTVRGELRVSMSYEDFVNMLKTIIAGIEVDEEWYAAAYPDIGQAIRDGRIPSAKQHFVDDGYFEGRLPFAVPVQEAWYLEKYPDVADYLRRGMLESAQKHFDDDGYREGRLPFAL